jgi:hypothetical protein
MEPEWGELPIPSKWGARTVNGMGWGYPPSVEARIRLVRAVTAALVLSGLVVATAWRDRTPLGFIPGCAVSAAVQTHSFLRRQRSYPMPVGELSVIAAKEEIV